MTETHAASINGAEQRLKLYEPRESWPEPDARLLNGGPRVAPKFPLDVMGELGPWVADLAAAKRAPADYVAVPLLAMAAGVVGAARDVRIEEGWREPCVLWVACIGNPSSGKSPPLATLKRSVMALERSEAGDMSERKREYEQRRIEAEAVCAAWEASVKSAVQKGSAAPMRPDKADEPEPPVAPRLLAADATREALARLGAKHPRGLLLVLDELAGLIGNFGKYGGADEPFYLAAYGGDFSPVDRVKGDTLTADRLYLSMVGAIQPDRMQALLSGRADDGLVSRFLPVWPDPPARFLREVPIADEAFADVLFARLRSLSMEADAAGNLRPRELRLSEDAAAIFFDWCEDQHVKTNEAHAFMAGFLGKSRGTCARVALVLELLEWAANGGQGEGPGEISADAMERACDLFESYFEPMARRVYADASLPMEERYAVALLKELRSRNARRFNARIARREWGVPGLSDASAMSAACEVLRQCDCIREIRDDEQKGPGRNAKEYLVNPRLLREERA